MRNILIPVALALSSAYAMGAEPPDSADSRNEAATRYADTYDLHSRIDSLTAKVTKDLPPEERDQVVSLIRKHMHYKALREIQIESLAKTFTTRELNALEAFCRTEDGRSIMSKYGTYALTIMPALNAEFERTLAEVKAELKDKSGAK